jgi:murein DD-endopeptidase MepM/ murein hydrolase activator NlpD
VDIFAPIGSQFVAVTDGVVDFVSETDRWDPEEDNPAKRGGIAVAIIGDDGVRYYGSHLSELTPGLTVGKRLTAGELIGYTGNSGNARGTSPHLHFGISHPTTPEDWAVRRGEIDPYAYLKAWESGWMLTPGLP